jgi:hypothetical protein
VLVKRLVSSKEVARPVTKRLEERIKAVERQGRVSVPKSGVFGYETKSKADTRRGVASPASLPSVKVRSSMVADEYEYQSRRQRDIRSRLEVREQQKAARRGGPLGGRLGTHKVFRRLE